MPPSPVRGASWKARKRGRCRMFFEAAEGTRTLDLLHGKQFEADWSVRFLPANEAVPRLGSRSHFVGFRRVCPGLCQPIVNQKPGSERAGCAVRACSHSSTAATTGSAYSMSQAIGSSLASALPRTGMAPSVLPQASSLLVRGTSAGSARSEEPVSLAPRPTGWRLDRGVGVVPRTRQLAARRSTDDGGGVAA